MATLSERSTRTFKSAPKQLLLSAVSVVSFVTTALAEDNMLQRIWKNQTGEADMIVEKARTDYNLKPGETCDDKANQYLMTMLKYKGGSNSAAVQRTSFMNACEAAQKAKSNSAQSANVTNTPAVQDARMNAVCMTQSTMTSLSDPTQKKQLESLLNMQMKSYGISELKCN